MLVRARRDGARRVSAKLGVLAVALAVAATGGMLAPTSGGAAHGAPAPTAQALAATFGFEVQLGPEQRLLGPSGEVDLPFFSERDADGKLFGVVGTSRTKVWRTANNTRLSKPRLILDRGRAGRFDECGAWMLSIQRLARRHWIGFYHAENKGANLAKCDHIADTTVWRMAIAETTNGGRTWFRPNYPNNVILTGTGADQNSGQRHAGNGRVVKVGNYFYMFFQAAHSNEPDEPGTYIARATVASEGRPGSWKKWFCHPATLLDPAYCAFDENGIGGKSTPIPNLSEKARFVSWNSYLGRWIGLDASGRRGFRLSVSAAVPSGGTNEDVLLDWGGSVAIYPPVSSPDDQRVDQWGGSTRDRKARQLYAYPSILGTTGSSGESGQTFYIYYMKLFPGDKFDKRYLFRRKVTIVENGGSLHRVELTLYKNRRTGERRSTTEAPKAKIFRRDSGQGYLLAQEISGWKQALECSRRGDFAIFVGPKCRTGWKPYRRIGWLHPTKTADASVPVFRCFNRRLGNHFASNSPRCGGAKRELRIGFALRSLS